MSSSDSLSSPVKPQPLIPSAEARRRLSAVLTVVCRITWGLAVAFFFMMRSMNQDWSNSCHRVLAGKHPMVMMVTLCFSSAIPSFVGATVLRFFLNPVAGLEEKMRPSWVGLGVGYCLVSSWSGVFSVLMWVQMKIANTIDCKDKALYDFSVGAAIVTNLGVLVFYLGLGYYARSG